MTNLLYEKTKISSFDDLIYPIEFSRFENEYWEQKPLFIERGDKDYYQSLISLEDVDTLLDLARPNGSSLRVVKNQEALPANKYENQDGSLNLNQIYVAYADGYTIVVNEVERFWKPIREFCQNLQLFFNCKVVANMYLTPKGQKALLPHYDTHDVYAIQIHGKKHWKLYDPEYATPILNSFQPIFQREQLKNCQDVEVNAGDVLYVPRGVPHEAISMDESSLHLTIGVYPVQWMDLLSKAIYHAALTNLDVRKSLPIGFLNGIDQNQIKSKFEELTQQIIPGLSTGVSLNLIAEEFRMSQRLPGDGHFIHLDNLNNVDINSRIENRDGLTATVQNAGNDTRIVFPGNVIKGPIHISPCFEFIANAKSGFLVNEIPLVNDENKIKIVQRLIRGGLLKVVD